MTLISQAPQRRPASTLWRALAAVLVRIALPDNVSLAHDPSARSVVLRRGIPSTLNTPALDEVLMLDGRQPDLLAQARGAIAEAYARGELTDKVTGRAAPALKVRLWGAKATRSARAAPSSFGAPGVGAAKNALADAAVGERSP